MGIELQLNLLKMIKFNNNISTKEFLRIETHNCKTTIASEKRPNGAVGHNVQSVIKLAKAILNKTASKESIEQYKKNMESLMQTRDN